MSELAVQATTAYRNLSGYARTEFIGSAERVASERIEVYGTASEREQIYGFLTDARSFYDYRRSIPSPGDWIAFHRLARKWREERGSTSSPSKLVNTESYRKIIGMGPKAIEMLLSELQRQPDFWFAALRAVTDEDPVPDEARGNVKKMREAWLDWGVHHGYIEPPNGHR
jgi:hypothetical protein